MKRKLPSPAASENEFDISATIAGTEPESRRSHHPDPSSFDIDVGDAPSPGNGIGDSDEDEAYIAAQQAASNRKSSSLKGRTVTKGGGFHSMGLNALLLKAIARKGFAIPTPIQRKSMPQILDGLDVVGMARTGSGKTAAFVIPMIEKLKSHSAKVGARALILSPSRELAIQTIKVVKELGRGTDLRTILLVGGDSLEDQFSDMTTNPDIIIATPGRFLHLKIEMRLDISSINYVVFDEADRLFEMGFATQLQEILHGLPSSRQTLLFSATLPSSLVEFARAGLQEPRLIRLDVETKISPDLECAFFTCKSAEKEGALLYILQEIIEVPTGTKSQEKGLQTLENPRKGGKKSSKEGPADCLSPKSVIVFAATKHHVEYLSSLLRHMGYSVAYVYGSLDQTARKLQVQSFRTGIANILVVTDVAARGIDMPFLTNVINYDFPPQPKVFVHRVGRTARAGRKGWSYCLVQDTDVPYLLDLQLFLNRKLVIGRECRGDVSFTEDIVVGALPRDEVGSRCEWISKLLEENSDFSAQRVVAGKGEKLYIKTRKSASTESVKRAKEVLGKSSTLELNLLFDEETNNRQTIMEDLLVRVRDYRPQETIFEVGKQRSSNETADMVRNVRKVFDSKRVQARNSQDSMDAAPDNRSRNLQAPSIQSLPDTHPDIENEDPDSDGDLEVTMSRGRDSSSHNHTPWQETEHFLSYLPRTANLAEERGYGVHSGSNTGHRDDSFFAQARDATLDLGDDDLKGFGEPNNARRRWDKRAKKYVGPDQTTARKKQVKIRGESGETIAAEQRSGRFDAWKRSRRIGRLAKVGELEAKTPKTTGNNLLVRKYRHVSEKAPKDADRYRDDYHTRKKRVAEAKEKRIGRFKEGSGKTEVRGVDDIRRLRSAKEKRRMKTGRHAKRPKK